MKKTTIDDVESLRAAMAAGLHPSFLFFWGHTAIKGRERGQARPQPVVARRIPHQ